MVSGMERLKPRRPARELMFRWPAALTYALSKVHSIQGTSCEAQHVNDVSVHAGTL